MADKENQNSNSKCLRSQSPESGGETSPVKKPKRDINRRIPLEAVQKLLQNSPPGQPPLVFTHLATADMIPSPQTPVPSPYRQTPAPLTVSQNYMRRLAAERWDAEARRCEEARKAQLLELQLAAHGITKLV
ncbi:hypothetical protein P692DRAFT_20760416 [Suillus brevipes Sb2]|nr:hypothetical protein P692DRAFT_20760416 [Suillus brevipes Sb2]